MIEQIGLKDPEARTIVRDASWYTVATYVSQFAMFFAGTVTKRFLGPTSLGVWSLINIVLQYMAGLQFGTTDAVGKEVPYLVRKGLVCESDLLRNVMFTFTTTLAILGSLGVLGYLTFSHSSYSIEFVAGIFLIAFFFPLWQLQNGQIVIFRALKQFEVLSKALLLSVVINASLTIWLVWWLGIYGQYLAFAVILVTQFLYFFLHSRRNDRLKIGFEFDLHALRRLWGPGIPLQVAGIVATFRTTLDSLIVANYLGLTAVGYYALALTVQNYIFTTPNAFSIVMYPRFQERFAASADDPKSLLSYVTKPIVGLSFFLLPLMIGASYFLAPTLIRQVLPNFLPTIPVVKILLAGTFFLSLGHMPGQFLISTNRLWQRVILSIIAALVLVVACYLAIVFGGDLESVAVAVAISNAIALMLSLCYTLYHVMEPKHIPGFVVKIWVAFLYMMFVLMGVDTLISDGQVSFLSDIAVSGAKFALSIVCLLPLFAYANKEVRLWESLWAVLPARLRITATQWGHVLLNTLSNRQ